MQAVTHKQQNLPMQIWAVQWFTHQILTMNACHLTVQKSTYVTLDSASLSLISTRIYLWISGRCSGSLTSTKIYLHNARTSRVRMGRETKKGYFMFWVNEDLSTTKNTKHSSEQYVEKKKTLLILIINLWTSLTHLMSSYTDFEEEDAMLLTAR